MDSHHYDLSAGGAFGSDAIGEGFDLQLPANMIKANLSYPFRYVETLLLYAEAAVELGNNATALQTVNQLEQWQGHCKRSLKSSIACFTLRLVNVCRLSPKWFFARLPFNDMPPS
ncbi:MAG: RagB/SusD family nutrient uptake outer membrane protein [Tannerella sp.]|jgi:hypothetical protein|nr:RagB/SusD family nutrient uptake outer membrane protein [Tannerella sp.]